MPDFKGWANFDLVTAFVVPGLVIAYVRSRFITGRAPSQSENLLSYVVLSFIYYSLILPFLKPALAVSGPWMAKAAVWVCLILLGPALLGVAFGAWAQKGYGSWIADKIGLGTVHAIPTAWDWQFSNAPRGGMFVMATLSDGSRVAGFFGPRSFASSDKDERDLYLEEEYDVSELGEWHARDAKVGILIPLKDIRYIEFWEPTRAST